MFVRLLSLLAILLPSLANHDCPSTGRRLPSDKVFKHQARVSSRSDITRFTLVGVFHISAQDCQTVLEANSFGGFQCAEAMVYALNKINKEVLEGKRRVSLDGYILDSCINGISAIAGVQRALGEIENIAGILSTLI